MTDPAVAALFSSLPPAAGGTPGYAVRVERGDEVLCAHACGQMSLEYGLPITADTVFHVASVSKQFTALAVTLLEEEGRLSLSDPVRRHFPELPPCMDGVTLRHLVHHTSGLREQWDLFTLSGSAMEDLATSGQTLRALARQQRLNFTPGECFQYCNSGYVLLAQLVARVTGQSLRQFADARIFAPLGMAHTYFRDDHREVCPMRAESYDYDGGRYRHLTLTFDIAGNTSLNTTAADLCLWLRELERPRVLPPQALARMTEPFRLLSGAEGPYCRGLRRSEHRGVTLYAHTGANAGFRAAAVLVPQLGLRIAVLSNYAAAQPMQKALALLEHYGGDALCPAPANPYRTDAPFSVCDGYYLNGCARVCAHTEGDGAVLLRGEEEQWRFSPTGGNEGRCAASGACLYAQDDGSLVRRDPSGSAVRWTPVQTAPIPDGERALAGIYFSEELLSFLQVRFEGGQLLLCHLKREPLPFCRLADGRYLSLRGEGTFLTLQAGAPPALVLDKERSQGLRFLRTELR